MLATAKPGELITLSIVRARFCERLAQLGGIVQHGDAFMMGLFSLLDALIDCPLDEALREVELGSGITEALLGIAPEQDVLTKIYRLTRRYEMGDWDEIEGLAARLRSSCRCHRRRLCGIDPVGRAPAEPRRQLNPDPGTEESGKQNRADVRRKPAAEHLKALAGNFRHA